MKKLPILIILTVLFIHAISAETLNDSNDVYYCPQSDGYVGEIPDNNIHDSGMNGGGDSLEVYCRNNVIRLCLSEEPCPWRSDIFSNDESTCSGNYGNSPMAFSANEIGINLAALIGTGNQRIENIYCDGISWSVEFSEANENPPENNPAYPINQNICNGCEFQDSCVPFGYRLENQNESVYCDLSKVLKLQKEQNVSCQNEFECLSGQCSDGKCINLQKTLEETNSTLAKIINFLKEFFGFE